MKADATPTKEFFVNMITKDISLEDCLLDLIDNCLDGVRRKVGNLENEQLYDSFHAKLDIKPNKFVIEDNCGGISINNAIDYAFHFGRRPDAPDDADSSIGLYGIGMKRAILKIGKNIKIRSSTEDEAFLCTIRVEEWLQHDRWEFDMIENSLIDGTGTVIEILDLYGPIATEFEDATFVNRLTHIVARDYTRFFEKGFKIFINDSLVESYGYTVAAGMFKAYRKRYEDDGVIVEIVAGMATPPPDDNEPSEHGETRYIGWFVFCNDRVVLAADKTERTVWGHEGFARWHPQYNGFIGMARFYGKDPKLLPWTTTKRNVDESSPIYRRAVTQMKMATKPWIEYTNRRKADLEAAKRKEAESESVPIFSVEHDSEFEAPPTPEPLVRLVNIHYQKPLREVQIVAAELGNKNLAYRNVGIETFNFFLENEVSEEE